MADIKRTTLFGKLNSFGYKALENAAVFCKTRGNRSIEVVHWLHQAITQSPESAHAPPAAKSASIRE